MNNKYFCNPPKDNNVRFLLKNKDNPQKPLICIGLNPSIANEYELDPTMKKIEKITEKYECDSWIMLNIYPLRKTKPNNLHKKNDELTSANAKNNLKVIRKVIKKYKEKDAIILCAWGYFISERDYLKKHLKDIKDLINELKADNKLKCLAKTKNGHPRHPLYCKIPDTLPPFDINQYRFKKN